MLQETFKDHVTNEEVRNRIQNAIGVHDDLLTIVKKRKLRWYGHISRSSGMAKTILQGTVKGLQHMQTSFSKPSTAQTYKLMLMPGLRHPVLSKKISNDQELIQSDPISCPQNQKGNN